MLRVTLVVPMLSNAGGGLAEAVRMQASALARHGGVAVEIVTTRDRPRDRDDLVVEDLKVLTFPYYGPSGFRFSPGMFWYLLRSRPDVLHLHGLWNFAGLAVLVWALIHRGRYVISPHGMLEPWILARSSKAKAVAGLLWQNQLLRRAAACCALTVVEAAQLRARTPAPLFVIPNFVTPFGVPNSAAPWWDAAFEDKTVFLFLCRIHDKKGWRELCAAWDQLCADPAVKQEALLVLCGWLDAATDFLAIVSRLNARCGNVIYAGSQYGAAKAATLSHADFFVLPSKSEGLPMGVLEAWSAGVPALISIECRLPEGFESGAAIACGTEVDSIVVALREALTRTLAQRRTMSTAAQNLVRAKFSENRVIGDLLQLYRRVTEVSA